MIQRAFISHREAVLFQLIRTELRRVEYADGTGALAKVRPAEARLIADPALQARVRLRLGGSSFPPQVYYRVFTSGAHAHQLDGRQLELEPRALRDARRMMGVQRFADVHGDAKFAHALRAPAGPRAAHRGDGGGRNDGAGARFASPSVDRWHRLSGADNALAGLRLAPGLDERLDLLVRDRPDPLPRRLGPAHMQWQVGPTPVRSLGVRRTALGGTYGFTGQPLPASARPSRFSSAISMHTWA